MDAEYIQTRRGAPVTEQPWLDMFALERLLQEGVVEEVNLADGQVVQCPKVSVYLAEFFRGERACPRLAAVRGFRFRLGGYGCHRCSPGCLAARRLLSPGLLGRDPASRVSSARGRTRSFHWASAGPPFSLSVFSAQASRVPAVRCVASPARRIRRPSATEVTIVTQRICGA